MLIMGILSWIVSSDWRKNKAEEYYRQSKQSTIVQERLILLEKANTIYKSQENSFRLAQTYAEIGQTDRAMKVLMKLDSIQSKNFLGEILIKKGDYQEAKNVFLSQNKPDIKTLMGLIEAEMKLGNYEEAKKHSEDLLRQDNSSEALCKTISLILSNETKEAFNYFKKAKNCQNEYLKKFFQEHQENQNPDYLKLKGAAFHYQVGYLELALQEILALQKENPYYRDAFILGYQIYKATQNQAETQKQKEKVLNLDPLYEFEKA